MNEAPTPEPSLIKLLRIVIAVLVLLAAGLIVWAVVGGDGDSDEAPAQTQIVTVAELSGLTADADGFVYWAGLRPGAQLEYDEADGDRVYVRYLTAGAQAEDPRPAFLTIATYPLADPVAALLANARRTRTQLRRAAGGALVWVNPDQPTSAYLAEPGAGYQVEVYDPSPRRALDVALSGDVVPVE